MTARLDLVVVYKQIIHIQQSEVPPKNYMVKLHGKIWTLSTFKKPLNL